MLVYVVVVVVILLVVAVIMVVVRLVAVVEVYCRWSLLNHVFGKLACSRVLRAHVLYVITCSTWSHACVLSELVCFMSLGAHMPYMLTCLRASLTLFIFFSLHLTNWILKIFLWKNFFLFSEVLRTHLKGVFWKKIRLKASHYFCRKAPS